MQYVSSTTQRLQNEYLTICNFLKKIEHLLPSRQSMPIRLQQRCETLAAQIAASQAADSQVCGCISAGTYGPFDRKE